MKKIRKKISIYIFIIGILTILTGIFIHTNQKTITYKIQGDYPKNYKIPQSETHLAGTTIKINSLKKGKVIKGYRFLGWEYNHKQIQNEQLKMPRKDIQLIGSFEKQKYQVSYAFQGEIIPQNANDLLPKEKSYTVEDTVQTNEKLVSYGYHFLGWSEEETFKMPDHDIKIYGQWVKENGTFPLEIYQTIEQMQNNYQKGEEVKIKITVENKNEFPVYDVMIKLNDSGVIFTEEQNKIKENIMKIPKMNAKEKLELKAEYKVNSNERKKITSTVTIADAKADNDYYLDRQNNYEATTNFITGKVSLKIINQEEEKQIKNALFGLYQDSNCEQLIAKGSTFENLEPEKTYYLKEIQPPEDYTIYKDIIAVHVNENGKIQMRKQINDGSIKYRSLEEDKSSQTKQKDGLTTLTINRTEIAIIPGIKGENNTSYIIVGLIIMISSIGSYVYYITRRREI